VNLGEASLIGNQNSLLSYIDFASSFAGALQDLVGN
jgi:hypothetical protein